MNDEVPMSLRRDTLNEPVQSLPPAGEAAAPPDEEAVAELAERDDFVLTRRLFSPRTLISFLFALALIVFVFRGLNIDIEQTLRYMRSANPLWMLTAFGVFYLTFPLRAIRWRVLLLNANVPIAAGRTTWASQPALMEYIYLSWFANCIVPAKLGDAYRAYLLKHNGHVSFSSTFGTIFAERLLDMIALFGLLVLSGWLTFGSHMPDGTQIVFAFGGVLVLAIIAGLAGMRWLSPLIHRLLPRRVHRVYGNFEQAALRSFRPAVLPQLIGLTGMVWLLEGFRLYFVILALSQDGLLLSVPAIIFVALASSLLTALPITPAGLGVVESTVTGVLILFGVDRNLGSAVTLLDRLINFWSLIVFGFLLYLVSKRK